MRALGPALAAIALMIVGCGRGEDRPTSIAIPEQGGAPVIGDLAPSGEAARGEVVVIGVEVRDRGCALRPSHARAGQLSFLVNNTGSTPARLLVLPAAGASEEEAFAELPPLAPLESTQFGLQLGPGDYQVRCDHSGDSGRLTGAASARLSVR